MTVGTHGDLFFEPGEKLPARLNNYYQDANNPLHFIPKYCECQHRTFIGTIKACSKRFAFIWCCSKFLKDVLIAECEACNVTDKSRSGTTESTIQLGLAASINNNKL